MKKPQIIAIAALTMDGKIARLPAPNAAGYGGQARSRNIGSSWTSREDKKFLHQELDKCDLIIVGNTTYKLARKPLAKRKCLVFTRKVNGLKMVNKTLTYCNPSVVPFPFAQKKARRICILGGAQVYSWFLKKKLLDEIFLTIEPVIFGRGLNLFDTNMKMKYKLISVKKLNRGGTLLLHYKKS